MDIKVKKWLESLGYRFILELGSKNQSIFVAQHKGEKTITQFSFFTPNDSFKAATGLSSVHFNRRL